MFGINDIGLFLLGTLIIILLPGPNSVYVLAVAAKQGMRHAYAGAAGIFIGDLVLMVLSVLGAASLLNTQPALFAVVKWSGALYLSWLGVSLILSAWKSYRLGSTEEDMPLEQSRQSAFAVWRKALLISLLNPKAILFFVSFFVQFVSPESDKVWRSFAVLVVIVQIFSLTYLSVLIFFGVRLAIFFQEKKLISAVSSGLVGLTFIGFGARLAAQKLHAV